MPGSNLGLLTFGCPLDTLYRWAFPAYFTNELFEGITKAPAAEPPDGDATTDIDRPARVGRWVNRYCMTDYIGNTEVAGSDSEVIPDPPEPDYIRGRPRPTLGAHTGYWTHPRVWRDIESLHLVGDPVPAARLEDRPGVPGVEQ